MNISEVKYLLVTGLSHTLDPQAVSHLALSAAEGPHKFAEESIHFGIGYMQDARKMIDKGIELLGLEAEQFKLDLKQEQEWKNVAAEQARASEKLEQEQLVERQKLDQLPDRDMRLQDLEPQQAAERAKLQQEQAAEREAVRATQALQQQQLTARVQQSLSMGWERGR